MPGCKQSKQAYCISFDPRKCQMAGNHDLQLIKCASDIKYWFKILQDLSVL